MRVNLYKRGRVWWAQWSEGQRNNTVRVSTGCTDKHAAELWARKREREAADPEHYTANKTALDSVAGRFLADLRADPEVAAGTLNMYECKAAHVVRVVGADTAMSTIDAPTVDRFVATREAEGASRSTIHKELVAFRGILKCAKRRGEYQRDPRAVMPLRFRIGYKPRERFLSAREIVKLVRNLSPGRAAAVLFIIATGARLSEFIAVRRSDVRGDVVHLRGTKTDGSDREVPIRAMPSLFARAMRAADSEGDRLFAPWSSMRRDVIRACKRAGIAPVTANDLRRTFATHHVQRGVHNDHVARAMGHATSAMVEKVYGKQSSKSLARLIDSDLCRPTPLTQPLHIRRGSSTDLPRKARSLRGLLIRRSRVRVPLGPLKLGESRSGASLPGLPSLAVADASNTAKAQSPNVSPARMVHDLRPRVVAQRHGLPAVKLHHRELRDGACRGVGRGRGDVLEGVGEDCDQICGRGHLVVRSIRRGSEGEQGADAALTAVTA
jgi:integrase